MMLSRSSCPNLLLLAALFYLACPSVHACGIWVPTYADFPLGNSSHDDLYPVNISGAKLLSPVSATDSIVDLPELQLFDKSSGNDLTAEIGRPLDDSPSYFCVCSTSSSNVGNVTGNLHHYNSGWYCVWFDSVQNRQTYCGAGSYKILLARYLNDPYLVLSTVDSPVPSDALPWGVPGNSAAFICVVDSSTFPYTPVAGNLEMSSNYKEWICAISTLQSSGQVGSRWFPGSFYVLAGSYCLIP